MSTKIIMIFTRLFFGCNYVLYAQLHSTSFLSLEAICLLCLSLTSGSAGTTVHYYRYICTWDDLRYPGSIFIKGLFKQHGLNLWYFTNRSMPLLISLLLVPNVHIYIARRIQFQCLHLFFINYFVDIFVIKQF